MTRWNLCFHSAFLHAPCKFQAFCSSWRTISCELSIELCTRSRRKCAQELWKRCNRHTQQLSFPASSNRQVDRLRGRVCDWFLLQCSILEWISSIQAPLQLKNKDQDPWKINAEEYHLKFVQDYTSLRTQRITYILTGWPTINKSPNMKRAIPPWTIKFKTSTESVAVNLNL